MKGKRLWKTKVESVRVAREDVCEWDKGGIGNWN